MLDLSRDIHSLTDFKRNTSDYVKQMKKTKSPVVLTVNGKAELVVQCVFARNLNTDSHGI